MFMRNSWYANLLFVFFLAIPAKAHMGNAVYPIPQLTEEMMAKIRFEDGSVDEWYDLVGEPTFTQEDFRTSGNREFDPSNLDFRIWLAWHNDPDRLYAAFSSSDNQNLSFSRLGMYFDEDSFTLSIDGDHSGGEGKLEQDDYEGMDMWWESQQYVVFSHTDSVRLVFNALSSVFTRDSEDSIGYVVGFLTDRLSQYWMVLPPYGTASGNIGGAASTNVIELFVTPYDDWQGYGSSNGPEDIVFSELSEGKIIGFCGHRGRQGQCRS